MRPPRRRFSWRRVLGGVLAGGAAFLLWSVVWEPGRLVVREEAVTVLGVPALRVALIGDLHAGAPFIGEEKMARVVAETNARHPDLVLLLGDYVIGHRGGQGVVGGHAISPQRIAAALGQLRAPLGVFAVLGNHDWWIDGPGIRRALEPVGIHVLDNEAARIEVKGRPLWLAGFADAMTREPEPVQVVDRIPQGAPIVGFMHSPDAFPDVPSRVALTFAAHSHGGQVRLPFWGALFVPSRFGTHYAQGLFRERGHLLFVTTGVGTSLFPIRFGVPPEVVVMDLVEKAN